MWRIVHKHRERRAPSTQLERNAPALDQRGPVRRKRDPQTVTRHLIPPFAEILQRLMAICPVGTIKASAGGGGRLSKPSLIRPNSLEHHRGRQIPPKGSGHRGAIGAAHPDPHNMLPVKPDRPRVAVPVGRAGF